jgi:hypothetical protein
VGSTPTPSRHSPLTSSLSRFIIISQSLKGEIAENTWLRPTQPKIKNLYFLGQVNDDGK